MWTSQRLAIIGTTHVDKFSVERVRKTISQTRPSLVAVELDEQRLLALRDSDRERLDSPVRSGLLPWLLALLERSAGSLTEVFPGTEMLEAVEEAHRVGAGVVLIDRPIDAILEDLRNIPFLEKLRIGIDTLTALIGIGASLRVTKLAGADLQKLMAEFDEKYPTLSRILVKERDTYMADRLKEILESTNGQVLAVVGLGHVDGITRHLAGQYPPRNKDRFELRYKWTVGTFT